MSDPKPEPTFAARRFLVTGRVQGVGFRPFVYRLALAHGLRGWVRNLAGEVEIVAQGEAETLAHFAEALQHQAPPFARGLHLRDEPFPAQTLTGFEIRASAAGRLDAHLPPDVFVCDDCLRELHDPADRRHRYPFINCTQCGPRYTVITALPYDRANTAMHTFALCAACRAEYENPADRRFHAEPLACPDCGPRLQYYSEHDGLIDNTAAALAAAVTALRGGAIVAAKGIGGYHLLCDAHHDTAVARLRAVKPRPHKPLAVMFPWRGADGLDAVRLHAEIQDGVAQHLRNPERPIVLVPRRADSDLSQAIAPGLDEIGAFLPYSPLHHLLLSGCNVPLVATSANVSGEPVLTDNVEVEARLAHVADAFLHHDRPIVRPADDSVYRVIAGRPRPLRLGRGVAPLELELPSTLPRPLLAVGGHMKNTVALAWDRRVVVSPHIGDLGSPRSLEVFGQVIEDLQQLYDVRAEAIVGDAHPGYASTRWAHRAKLPLTRVFHHHAHAAALAGEHPQIERWLVFTWDGTGYGEDGTLWAGEALLGAPGEWKRVGSFRPFHLPGGEKAGREPWRSALALCWETGVEWPGCPEDSALLLRSAWAHHLNAPPTSAVGRLFDAAAALAGVNLRSSFEGQGPMLLEAIADPDGDAIPLPTAVDEHGVLRSDWAPLLPVLMDSSLSASQRAACFHATLARALCDQARRLHQAHGGFVVGLAGGVFQNRRLTDRVLAVLAAEGFELRLPLALPTNDAAISYGQVVEAGAGA